METMKFASYELKRYAAQMGICPEVHLKTDVSAFDVSCFFQFDVRYDDAFSVEVKQGKGTITGINERSVLLGVYHFLKKQGCRFLRPGKDGEYIPFKEHTEDVSETWYAATRHRGTTNMYAGSGLGLFGILEYIDWLPKMMMNSFFIEFVDYYTTVCGWFRYSENPYRQRKDLKRETFDKYDSRIIEEMKKRGLIRHGAGHGWTVALMEGVSDMSRGVDNNVCKNTEILAEIAGKRDFFNEKPLFTNLCYSQPQVRKKIAESVYEYSLKHPEVDIIHVWLADYFNNFCECENCRKLSQADWYVRILNEIDEEFTRHGSDRKIAFLIYFELAYPPLVERIKNEKRFVMMFAPYGRNFLQTYEETQLADYVRKPLNQFAWSDMRMEYYLTQLKEWQKIFKGDSFVFDYSLFDRSYYAEMTDVYYTPLIYKDCNCLDQYGLNGRIECGDTKAMTPTALPFHAMAETLFYKNASYEEIEADYFASCYGDEKICQFLHKMSALLPSDYMMLKTALLTVQEQADLKEGLSLIEELRVMLLENVPENAYYMKNKWYFEEYLDILEYVLSAFLEMASGRSAKTMEEYIEEYRKLIFRKEGNMPMYLSGFPWFNHICSIFRNSDQYVEF